MKVEFYYSRHMAEARDTSFNSVAEAARMAIFALDDCSAWPLKILADGKTVWENPGLGEDIRESLKALLPNTLLSESASNHKD